MVKFVTVTGVAKLQGRDAVLKMAVSADPGTPLSQFAAVAQRAFAPAPVQVLVMAAWAEALKTRNASAWILKSIQDYRRIPRMGKKSKTLITFEWQ